MIDPETLPYRPCVGVMLINAEGLIFAGQRLDNPVAAWQMPKCWMPPVVVHVLSTGLITTVPAVGRAAGGRRPEGSEALKHGKA